MNRTIKGQIERILSEEEATIAANAPTSEDILDMLNGPEAMEMPELAYADGTGASMDLVLADPEYGDQEAPNQMSDDELVSIVTNMATDALSGDDESELSGELVEAMDYYFMRGPTQDKEGRSNVISSDLADMVEAMLADILPTYTLDMSVEFESEGEGDERTAEEESALCNRIVQQENQGFVLWYELIKSALLQKNCIAKVYVEDNETFTRDRYDQLPALAFMQMQMEAQGQNQTLELEEYEMQQAPGGILLTNVVIRKTSTSKRIRIASVPMSEIRVQGDHKSISLMECAYVEHFREVSASYLIEQGYDPEVVDTLTAGDGQDDSLDLAMNQTTQEGDNFTYEYATRPIMLREAWLNVDFDGDGVAEFRKVVIAGEKKGVVLENIEEPHGLFASGTAFINPSRWLGLSLHDKLKQVQDSKTDFLRQAHDNARTGNNARLGYVVGQVRVADLFNSKPGSGVAMKRADSIVPIPHQDMMPSINTMLAYQDKMRTERAGAALDMQSEAMSVGPQTAHGTERQMTAKEALAAMITETISQTVVRDVYLIVHRLVRENFQGPQSYKAGNGWTQTDPSQWPVRDRVKITVGKSRGERMRQAATLEQVYQKQLVLLQQFGPGVMVSPDKIYNTLVDLTRMSGLTSGEQYWIDPASPEAQQAAQQNQQQAQQQQQQAEQQQAMQLQMMSSLQLQLQTMQEETKRMKAILDQQQANAELVEDRRQHVEDSATEITALELEHAQDASVQRDANM